MGNQRQAMSDSDRRDHQIVGADGTARWFQFRPNAGVIRYAGVVEGQGGERRHKGGDVGRGICRVVRSRRPISQFRFDDRAQANIVGLKRFEMLLDLWRSSVEVADAGIGVE